ncbi:MAG: SH3 domain-containing protein [Caldilineaceae bacterium]
MPQRVVSAATPVPTSPVPLDVSVYALKVLTQVGALSDAVDQIGSLMRDPQVGSDEWVSDLGNALAAIQEAHTALTKIVPPAAMKDIHRQALSGSQDCYDFTVQFVASIKANNSDDMIASLRLLESCDDKMAEAGDMMRTYTASLAAQPTAVATVQPAAKATAKPPTVTADQSAAIGTVSRNANLRQGPGTSYAVVGSLVAGDTITIVDKNPGGDWYKLDNGKWVAAFLVTLDERPDASAAPTPRASATKQPSATATPVNSAVSAFQSGGLGQPQSWWRAKYGAGVKSYGFVRYGVRDVMFSDDDKAAYIEISFDPPISAEEARSVGESLLPRDSVLQDTYSPPNREETLVGLYYSPSLAKQFASDDVWIESEPGQFIVLYDVYQEGVTRVIAASGNNP